MAGRSRSATIVAAYLMQHFKIGVGEAISKIKETRFVYPNRGFQEQLQVYGHCNYTVDSTKAAYRSWATREETQSYNSPLEGIGDEMGIEIQNLTGYDKG
jgi:hypothetical protein